MKTSLRIDRPSGGGWRRAKPSALRDVLKPNAVCDVYVFNTPRGELMIPALKRVVKTVDVDAGVMTLDSAALAEVAVWEDEPAERDE